MERIKLIDTIDIRQDLYETGDGGIFFVHWDYYHDENTGLIDGIPWLTEELSHELDRMYYLSHSGEKYISRAYIQILKTYGVLDTPQSITGKSRMAELVFSKFTDSWNRIYSALVESQYHPLDNYNMIQEETPDITHTKNVKQNITTKNDGYGFNSTSAVPQTESNISGDAEENEEVNKESGKRTLTRSGNIGVTTSQQMLQSELDLRSQNHFMDIIMNDTDSILCLLAY